MKQHILGLLIVFAISAPAFGQWGKTKWGMTKAELEAAYPGQMKSENRILGGKEAGGNLPMLPQFSVTGSLDNKPYEVKFKVFFVFDEKRGLQTVYLDSLTSDDEKALHMAGATLGVASIANKETPT